MATEYVGVRLDQDLVKRIDAVAETLSMTRSAVIDRVVRVGLREEEDLARMVEGGDLTTNFQRLLVKAMVSSDFVVKLMQMTDDEVDPKRAKMIRDAIGLNDAKKKGKAGPRPALE